MRLLSLMWTTLWVTWLAFVVLILTYPISRFVGRPHWDSIRWIPFSHLTLSPTDLFETSANVLIFVPLGFLTVRALAGRTNHPIRMACLFSFFCSACLELYQVFCDNRVPATTDLITNLTGGAIGGYVAAMISRSQRRG